MGISLSHTNRGKALESCVIASAGRLLRIRKMGGEVKRIGGGKMVATRGVVDFVGAICGSGRAICFDTKQCDLATRFPVGNRDHLPQHQRDYLLEQGGAGAVAGLLIEATALRKFFWLSWEHLKRDEASLPWVDPRLVELGDTFHTIRFERVPGVVGQKAVV